MLQLSAFIHFCWIVNLLCLYLCKCRVLKCAFSKRFVFRLKDATTERIKTVQVYWTIDGSIVTQAQRWRRFPSQMFLRHTLLTTRVVCAYLVCMFIALFCWQLCHWSHFVIRHLGGSLQPCTHSYTCIDTAQTPILCCLSASSGIFYSFCLFPLDCSSFSCFLMPDCFPFIRDSQS